MKVIGVLIAAFGSVGFATFFGFSEAAGLFGATVSVGVYLAAQK